MHERKYHHPDAIVLGLDINGLGVVRNLQELKITVLGIYRNKYEEIGRYSRFCRSIMINGKDNDDFYYRLLKTLLKIGESLVKKIVIFPTSDYYIDFINKNRRKLIRYYLFPLPENEIAKRLISKKGQYELALKHKIPIPQTHIFKTIEEYNSNRKNLNFPCIIKPQKAFQNWLPANAKNIEIKSYNEMESYVKNNSNTLKEILIQEIIPGGDSNTFDCIVYFNSASEPLGIFSAKKIRTYPPNYGTGSYIVSEWNDEIVEQSIHFLKKINFSGLADVEFVIDSRDNIPKFIEVNIRSHLSNSHPTACGINFPAIAFSNLNNSKYNFPGIGFQKNKIIWISLVNDLASFKIINQRNKLKLVKWFFAAIKADSFGCLSFKDLYPFLYSIFHLFTLTIHQFMNSLPGAKQRIWNAPLIKSFVKLIIGNLIYYSGIFSIIRFLVTLNGRKLTVVTYHRVTDKEINEIEYSLPYLFTTQRTFSKHLEFIKKKYNVISFQELFSRKENFRRNRLLITFDDGYEDNFHYAYPMLIRHSLPFLIFLVTGNVNKDKINWWDELFFRLKCLSNNYDDLKNGSKQLKDIFLHFENDSSSLFQELNEWDKDRIELILKELRGICRNGSKSLKENNRSLNWHQIRIMSDIVEFGSHTVSHINLKCLPKDYIQRELTLSRNKIAQNLKEVVALSYPAGQYSEEIIKLSEESGYLYAFTQQKGLNDCKSFHDLKRINIWEGTGNLYNGKFSKAVFALKLLGF